MRRRIRSVGLVVCMIAALLVPMTGAMAQDASNVGDPQPGNVDPHGGYSATTQFCLQCHDVHNAAGAYALMGATSVTAVCATCHALPGLGYPASTGPMNNNPPTNNNPDGTPKTLGTASSFSAYDLTSGANGLHPIGAPSVDGNNMTQSDYQYRGRFLGTDATTPAGPGTSVSTPLGNGLYCASCHTPHGEYGQVVNDPDEATDEGTDFYNVDTRTQYWLDYDGVSEWFACPTAGDVQAGAGVGTACTIDFSTITIRDEEGKASSLFGYKLLSAYPNHTWGSGVKSFKFDNHAHDTAVWCSTCHDTKTIDDPAIHNHPTGCLACHGNPRDGSSSDFPHTSTIDRFLEALPDALCISCHTKGSLP